MTRRNPQRHEIHSPALDVTLSLVPWDTAACGFAVAQIERLEIHDAGDARASLRSMWAWVSRHQVRLISCRLPEDRLRESMFLEEVGFRFVEMVLHPVKPLGQWVRAEPSDTIQIAAATIADLPALERIARSSFRHERFHVDPRLDPRHGDERYARWVRNTIDHPRQRLLRITHEGVPLGLFLVTSDDAGRCDWLLTAIAPEWQGQGYGKRVWRSMLDYHVEDGGREVRTTISARNSRVLGLYGSLGFRFDAPEMTFHWVASGR